VRVRPEVIHISDPLFIEQIYGGAGKRRDKYKTTTNSILAPGAIIATKDHDMHRRRRAVLNQLFSKKSIRDFEPTLQATLSKLLHRLDQWGTTGSPAPMTLTFKAATKDIVSNYCFGEGSSNSLDKEDLEIAYFESLPSGASVFVPLYFHKLSEFMTKMPIPVVIYLNPQLAVFIKFIDVRIHNLHCASDVLSNFLIGFEQKSCPRERQQQLSLRHSDHYA
jgi:hypothetical protein